MKNKLPADARRIYDALSPADQEYYDWIMSAFGLEMAVEYLYEETEK